MRDYLGEGEGGGGGVAVEISLDYVQVRCYGAEPVVGCAVGQVAQAEDLANLPRGEEFFELFVVNLGGRRKLQCLYLCGDVLF